MPEPTTTAPPEPKPVPPTGPQAEFKAALPSGQAGQQPVPQAGPQAEFKAAPSQGPPNNTSEAPQFRAAPTGGLPNNTPEKPEFRAAVGMSRKWDAREAGREVARDTLEKLGKDPDFFLLFSTIHYEKHGGFQELLNGVWDILPKGTPLIGGTVAGFINPQGCWTRGTTALAVNYPNMDIATGIGHNTKRNPQKAAKECAQQIKEKLGGSKYKNKFLLTLISGGTIPQYPIVSKKVIKYNIPKIFVSYLIGISQKIFQSGYGREDEILTTLTNSTKEYSILSGSNIDNMKFVNNYQFYGNTFFKTSIVFLGISIDLKIEPITTHGMESRDIKFKITDLSKDKRIINEINGKPAIPELLRLWHWPEEYLDENILRRVFYYPFGIKICGTIVPSIASLFVGNSVVVSYKIDDPEIDILMTSGRNLLKAVDQSLENFKEKNCKFALISSCAIRLETLGSNVFKVRNKLLNFFNDKPFLLFDVGGEATFSPNIGLICGNDMFNMAMFYKQNEC